MLPFKELHEELVEIDTPYTPGPLLVAITEGEKSDTEVEPKSEEGDKTENDDEKKKGGVGLNYIGSKSEEILDSFLNMYATLRPNSQTRTRRPSNKAMFGTPSYEIKEILDYEEGTEDDNKIITRIGTWLKSPTVTSQGKLAAVKV